MNLDLQVLRTQLQHACEDLRVLSSNDLAEGRWKIKKMIFSELLANSLSLKDYNEELQNLLERDSKRSERILSKRDTTPNIDQTKNSSTKRSSRQKELVSDEEMEFRTSFLRIVIAALTKLRWPPALEAFSDPIDSLFNDNMAVLDAYKYILTVGFPATASLEASSFKRNLHVVENTPRSIIDDKSSFASPFTQEPNPNSARSQHSIKPTNREIVKEIISYPFASPMPVGNELLISSKSTSGTPFTPKQLTFDPSQVTVKAFEQLQYHNELLAGQLSQLVQQLNKRDQAEAQLTAIITDLKTAVDEVVSIGSTGSASFSNSPAYSSPQIDENKRMKTYSSDDLKKDFPALAGDANKDGRRLRSLASFVTDSKTANSLTPTSESNSPAIAAIAAIAAVVSEAENEAYLKEIAREEGNLPPAASTSSTPSSNRIESSRSKSTPSKPPIPPSRPSPGIADSQLGLGIWHRLQKKLQAIQGQWTEARREAKMCASNFKAQYLRSNPFPDKKPATGSSGDANVSRRSSSSSSYSPYHIAGSPSKDGLEGADDPFASLSKPIEQLTKKALGLNSFSLSSPNATNCAEGGFDPSIGLDLPRIHLMQRDLINLSNCLFEWNSNSNDSHLKGGRFPCDEDECKSAQIAVDMNLRSCEMLLHLSCIAPVAALSLPDDRYFP